MLEGYVAWSLNSVRSLFLNIFLACRGFILPTAADDSYEEFQTNNGYAKKLVALLS